MKKWNYFLIGTVHYYGTLQTKGAVTPRLTKKIEEKKLLKNTARNNTDCHREVHVAYVGCEYAACNKMQMQIVSNLDYMIGQQNLNRHVNPKILQFWLH
jgi:hypothetical protein